MVYLTYTEQDVKDAIKIMKYKGNEDEVIELFYKVNKYTSLKKSVVKKTHDSFYLTEILSAYAMLSYKERKLYKLLISKYNIFLDYTVNKVSYKSSIDEILYWKVFDWKTIELMFIILRKAILFNFNGFKTKSEKGLIRDFAKKILYADGNVYKEEFKEFIISEYGTEGKKILMELSLGGK